MKSTEIENENENENVQQRLLLYTNKKRNKKTLSTESKGEVTIEGEYGTLKFERRLSHPVETVWKAITDQKEIFKWLPDYKGTFDGYNGGAIDLVNTVSGSHVTGNILVWDLHHVFEHEWHISPNQMFPHGEPESAIRWELEHDGDSDTIFTLTNQEPLLFLKILLISIHLVWLIMDGTTNHICKDINSIIYSICRRI